MNKPWTLRTWASLFASAIVVSSATALAQTPPPAEQPPTPPAEPPPPAAVTPPPAGPVLEGEIYPRMSNGAIMLGKETWIRIGLQAQVWADYLQAGAGGGAAATDGSYGLNMILRRARLIVGAQINKDVNLWFQFDAPRLGTGTLATTLPVVTCSTTQNAMTMALTTTCGTTVGKRFNAQDGGGEILQDAWGEVKFAGDAFMLETGLMVIPFSHNELQSTTTFLALDVGTVSTAVPFTSGTRDIGFQFKGYVLDEKLEYRLGVFSGNRQGTNGENVLGHNMPRITGHLQYDFLDVQKGYVYGGHFFGKQKHLGISAGFDVEKNDDIQAMGATTSSGTYWALSAGVYGAYPLSGENNKKGGDEIAFLAEYYRFDNGQVQDAAGVVSTPGTGTTLPQNDVLVEAAYYNNDAALSVFGKFEMRQLSLDNATAGQKAANNQQWIGGGIKYYVVPGSNQMNFTLFYQRILFPDSLVAMGTTAAAPSGANEFVLQAQLFYY